MKVYKFLKRLILIMLSVIALYGVVAMITTFIIVGPDHEQNINNDFEIYMNSDGVHLDFIIPIENLSNELRNDLVLIDNTKYLSFGCGEKQFFLNTPEWSDLTVKTTVNALFVNSETLIHVVEFSSKKNNWIAIKLNTSQLERLNGYISNSFTKGLDDKKVILENQSYWENDNFYESNYNYNCLTTCNTWVNSGLKTSDLEACLWTPFAFGIRRIYTD